MSRLQVQGVLESVLDWQYEPTHQSLRALYERAKSAQWSAEDDIDWSIEVPFGEPLPDTSWFSVAAFSASPLAHGGKPLWDAFQWELQSWMVSQFLHGEQGALVVAGRLAATLPDLESKYCAASQAVDEARHAEVFSRYLREHVPEPYPIASSLETLLTDILSDARWDITALGMQILVEALAMAAFRLADRTFHDALIRMIVRLVARDEARHVSFGVLSLEGIYSELTTAERADREEVVLEGAALMRRRFLLEDVWERLGIDTSAGVEFAATNELMVAYRQAIFARVVTSLGRIGLMTPKVHEGLSKLDLLGYSSARAAAAGLGTRS
ncbi:ferritin-like domain-containing protein [Saccharomonospora cyanea]|uniref:Ribonucleotide reductase, beta subunit n=1 Tax=Saccharomonospora cyanea NA-134 TaxID=882082 RepID=H5XHJ5_9PSEU|nr:ferritin-like domain-containing protein [Saccharomonospora cyanea]EHR61675.1 ribonucleotide reductase, beta subunit [Saccharomonospora cyanea NA-134]